MRKLYVGNLDGKIQIDELEALLAPYGAAAKIDLFAGQKPSSSNTFALIELDNYAAEAVKECLNGVPFKGNMLYIEDSDLGLNG